VYKSGVASIEDYLAVQEWQIAGIKKALKSLDQERAVPHSEVVSWVKS
jgi:predicted transcriptional regulator